MHQEAWPMIAGERYRDEPVKNAYSHICEALQYLMVGEGMDHKALVQSHASDEDEPVRLPKVHSAINRSGRRPNGPR